MTRTHEALKSDHLNLLINGTWVESQSEELLPVMDPGRGEEICKVPLALGEEIDAAAISSQNAFEKWRLVPLTERMQYLFKMKYVFEERFEELARINTRNHGKTIKESRGDVRRTIENVEAAIAAGYTLLKGEHLDQIAQDIDEGTVNTNIKHEFRSIATRRDVLDRQELDFSQTVYRTNSFSQGLPWDIQASLFSGMYIMPSRVLL
ncbi:MAG: aldehyde dehydrogenase family protein [Candidatus Bathyarchaeia archaeon]